jgi:hypothetical protein
MPPYGGLKQGRTLRVRMIYFCLIYQCASIPVNALEGKIHAGKRMVTAPLHTVRRVPLLSTRPAYERNERVSDLFFICLLRLSKIDFTI